MGRLQIGGGNTNVGLAYMDEAAKRRAESIRIAQLNAQMSQARQNESLARERMELDQERWEKDRQYQSWGDAAKTKRQAALDAEEARRYETDQDWKREGRDMDYDYKKATMEDTASYRERMLANQEEAKRDAATAKLEYQKEKDKAAAEKKRRDNFLLKSKGVQRRIQAIDQSLNAPRIKYTADEEESMHRERRILQHQLNDLESEYYGGEPSGTMLEDAAQGDASSLIRARARRRAIEERDKHLQEEKQRKLDAEKQKASAKIGDEYISEIEDSPDPVEVFERVQADERLDPTYKAHLLRQLKTHPLIREVTETERQAEVAGRQRVGGGIEYLKGQLEDINSGIEGLTSDYPSPQQTADAKVLIQMYGKSSALQHATYMRSKLMSDIPTAERSFTTQEAIRTEEQRALGNVLDDDPTLPMDNEVGDMYAAELRASPSWPDMDKARTETAQRLMAKWRKQYGPRRALLLMHQAVSTFNQNPNHYLVTRKQAPAWMIND
jgi:hypothetical protein